MIIKPAYNIVISVRSINISAYVVTFRSSLVWDLAQRIYLTRRFGTTYLFSLQ